MYDILSKTKQKPVLKEEYLKMMQTPLKGKIYKHLCKCVCVCVVYSRRIYINKLKKLSLRV